VEFLWMRGGPVATRFLIDAVEDGQLAELVASSASRAERIDIDAPLVRMLIEHEDRSVMRAFLGGDGFGPNGMAGAGVVPVLDVDQMLSICERSGADVRVLLLPQLAGRSLEPKQLKRAHELVREALRGADPKLGKAAEQFLTSSASQQSLEGMKLVLEHLRDLHRRSVPIGPWQPRSAEPPRTFSPAEVEVMLPAIAEAARAVAADGGGTNAWLASLMIRLLNQGAPGVLALGLEWLDLGYPLSAQLTTQVDATIVLPLLKRAHDFDDADRRRLLVNISPSHVDAEALPLLRALAPKLDPGSFARAAWLIGATGADAGVDWVMAQWREAKVRHGEHAAQHVRWVPSALLEAGRKNQGERVRSAMRDVVRGFGGPRVHGSELAALMLALMSMSDERTLDFLAVGIGAGQQSAHPYAEDQQHGFRPIDYLLQNGEPRHGYSEDQVIGVIARLGELEEFQLTHPRWLDPSRISDRVLIALAEHDSADNQAKDSWTSEVVSRLGARVHDGGDVSVLEPWFVEQLGRPGRLGYWMSSLPQVLVERHRDRIAALITGDDGAWAIVACQVMWQHGRDVDLARAVSNRHADVRVWALERLQLEKQDLDVDLIVPRLDDERDYVRVLAAQILGAKVAKKAVPALIARLRDHDVSVREAAAEALTRIRFYHEQQAHWDRVLKGMDASPQSAVEKLLLQARPDQNKAQRLLAIKSLGVLGKPEALPFLIDWSQQSDREIAAAALAAIERIHLK
ncbi:MAG: HEAT repeat domain-containing protein, partial [Planctomycetes bacterium]|nr:HEAT repeat domain-containing protein [Planctomycetota bacterium]